MTFGTVCSGIEAPSVAWPNWEARWFAEIEKFPKAVLAHHYPNVPDLGDFTTQEFMDHARANPVDVFCGGTPCQGFSAAGLRGGLDDDRSNLALQFLRVVGETRPTWVGWENVPGVFSTNEGRDFGAFLGGLAQLGYGYAYRTLDAQYFGVPQRRRRVFVVGYLGDWRPPAAVLFEREGLQGDITPRRETGQRVAPAVTQGPPFSRTGNERVEVDVSVHLAKPLGHGAGQRGNRELDNSTYVTFYANQGSQGMGDRVGVSPTLKVSGQVAVMSSGQANAEIAVERSPTLNQNRDGAPIVFTNRGEATPVATETLRSHSHGAIPMVAGFLPGQGSKAKGIGYKEEQAPTPKSGCDSYGVSIHENVRGEMRESSTAYQLSTGGGKPGQGYGAVSNGTVVRRLTPRECERLQGFPDDFTRIPYRGKGAEDCPDSPRYAALGNSIAVPVLSWIGKRIEMVDELIHR